MAGCRVIVKLGGSAITDKQQRQTLKPMELASIAKDLGRLHTELQQQQQQQQRQGIVVVHGAGSFGHFEAHEFQITRPTGQPQDRLREGFARTRLAVTALNHAAVSALVDAGVPAVGISPCGTFFPATQAGRYDDAAGIAAVQAVLAAGLVPVLHGDGIVARQPPPNQLVPAILSGDTIISRLAEVLQPAYVVFLADVPGLLTKPPSAPDTRLLHEVVVTSSSGSGSDGTLTWTAAGEQQVQLSAAAHDTTGGMGTKIQEAAAIAARGCPVVLAQAGTPSGRAAVLHGPDAFSGPDAIAADVRGTVVRLQQAEGIML